MDHERRKREDEEILQKEREEREMLQKEREEREMASRPEFGVRIIYLLLSSAVAILPIYLYVSVLGVEFKENLILFGIVTIGVSLSMSLGYSNVTFFERIKMKGEVDISRTKKEKLGKKDVIARKQQAEFFVGIESVAYSLWFNNIFYLGSVIVLGFWLFRSITPEVNYVMTSLLSAGLVALNSTKNLHKL